MRQKWIIKWEMCGVCSLLYTNATENLNPTTDNTDNINWKWIKIRSQPDEMGVNKVSQLAWSIDKIACNWDLNSLDLMYGRKFMDFAH